MADRFGLFIWVNDRPIQGNILRLTNIVKPRLSFEEYFVSQKVVVNCPGMGKHEALIGQLCDASEKKSMESVLASTEKFKSMIDKFGLEQVFPVEKNGSPQKQKLSCDKPAQDKSKSPSAKAKSPMRKPKPQSDKPANSKVAQDKSKPPSEEKKSPKKSPQRKHNMPQPKSNPPPEQDKHNKVTVVRPKPIKPVKRKLTDQLINLDNVDESISSDEKQNDPDKAKLKKLSQIAEDLAICDLKSVNQENQAGPSCSTGMVIREAMTSLYESPRRSPRHHNQSCTHTEEITNLNNEVSKLQAAVNNLQYYQHVMWQELGSLRSQQSLQANSTIQTESSAFSPTVNKNTTQVIETSQETPQQASSSSQLLIASPVVTYAGFTKSQIVSEIDFFPNYKKATTRAFRTLFKEQEWQGRSVTGQRSKTGTPKPAIEDQKKLAFLTECVQEAFPNTERTQINEVIRHLIKPSANKL